MAQFYKILKADPLGEPWESHGKKNQTYWCQVEGEDLAVSISKQVGNTLTPGQNVYGDLMKATSQKGTDYWKFKSAQVPEGVERPKDSAPQEVIGDNIPAWFLPFGNTIIENNKILKQLRGDEPMEEPTPEEPKEDLKATVEGIFNEPEPEV